MVSEIVKGVISLAVHLYQQHGQAPALPLLEEEETSTSYSLRQLVADIFGPESGFLKLLVPAIFYTIQNNLQLVAATNLDPATFQVLYQGKILTTAFFAIIILRQALSFLQWLSLFVLTLGVACVQVPFASTRAQEGNNMVGTVSVTVACICSGFAGVYLEKVLKSGSTGDTSLWIRNIQLSVNCFAVAVLSAFAWDGHAIYYHGFFQGYGYVTLLAILAQSLYGMIVALVIKYADNILKGFATSISIVLSAVVSMYMFNFVVTPYFAVGSLLTFMATFMYSTSGRKSKSERQREIRDVDEAPPMMDVAVDEKKGLEGDEKTPAA